MTLSGSITALAGGADAGGFPRSFEILGGNKFSFSCKISVVTAEIAFVEEVQLNNERNEFAPNLNDNGAYFDRSTGLPLSDEEKAAKLQTMEGSLMRQLIDANIKVFKGKSDSEFRLYLQGKMQGYSPTPFLTTSQYFSSDTKKIEAELLVSHGYTTEEYGLQINCLNNL